MYIYVCIYIYICMYISIFFFVFFFVYLFVIKMNLSFYSFIAAIVYGLQNKKKERKIKTKTKNKFCLFCFYYELV